MRKISALLSVPVLLGLGAAAILSLRTLDGARPAAEAETRLNPRYELQDAQWVRTGADGTPQFVAKAAQMTWYDDQSAVLRQTEISALGGSASPWRLTAPEGRMPPGSRDLLLSGPVRATGLWPDRAALRFNTERIWIDTAEQTLRTDADITLEGAGRHILATGLAADFAGSYLKLLSNVQARYEALPTAAEPGAPVPDEIVPAAEEDADAPVL